MSHPVLGRKIGPKKKSPPQKKAMLLPFVSLFLAYQHGCVSLDVGRGILRKWRPLILPRTEGSVFLDPDMARRFTDAALHLHSPSSVAFVQVGDGELHMYLCDRAGSVHRVRHVLWTRGFSRRSAVDSFREWHEATFLGIDLRV